MAEIAFFLSKLIFFSYPNFLIISTFIQLIQLFNSLKCETIKYMKIYLLVDVLLSLEVFERFRDTVFKKYKLDPSWFITTLSLAMAAALLRSKKN